MNLRKACYKDLAAIRQLPLQFTGKPVSNILHKQFRVMVLDARVQAMVLQDDQTVCGFLVLRPYISRGLSSRQMAIVHLGVTSHEDVSVLLLEAERIAAAQLCDSLLIQQAHLPVQSAEVYGLMGYEPLAETWTKTLSVALQK